MRLNELQACCDKFLLLDPDDRYTVALRGATGSYVDPLNPAHRRKLFQWLRQWGCRQFAIRDEAISDKSLTVCWSLFSDRLPSPVAHLHDLSNREIDAVAMAYGDLRDQPASVQRTRRGDFTRGFGPTGAAKAMHAVRPLVCPPWDKPIREVLGLPDNP